MEKLKSRFIVVYATLSVIITGHSGLALLAEGKDESWAGAFTTAVIPVMFFLYIGLGRATPRTTRYLPFLTVVSAIGFIVAVDGWWNGPGSPVAALYGTLSLLGWLAYDFWYSSYGPRDNAALHTGQRPPDFTVQDVHDRTVSFAELADRPAVFIFYRGNWCPFCMAQINELAEEYKKAEERGARLILISPQPQEEIRKLAEKFDVPFKFMRDPGGQAARTLGILHKDGLPWGLERFGYDSDTVKVTVFVTDREGRVVWLDLTDNYRVRPDPSVFLNVIPPYRPASSRQDSREP